MILKHL